MANWIAIVGVVVAVVAIPVTIWATRRWGNRRALIAWVAESVSLLPEEAGRDLIEVTYRSLPVKDPYLVTVVIANTGPRDLSSSSFDDGRPIRIHLGATFYGVTKSSGSPKIAEPGIGADSDLAFIEILPKLLKRQESWLFSVIVSGLPSVQVEAPLIDTDVRAADVASTSQKFWSTALEIITAVRPGIPFLR